MELEFGEHALERMWQYGVTEEQVLRTIREADGIEVGVGDAKSTNYVKHGIVRVKLSLRVALDPYKSPQRVNTVHPFDPDKPKRRKKKRKRRKWR